MKNHNYINKRLAPGYGTGTRKLAHILVVEKVLGKLLPLGAIVHHVDENGRNNTHDNLSVFPNRAYHKVIHSRLKVLRSGGNPSTEKICCRCKYLKLKEEFYRSVSEWDGFAYRCKPCEVAMKQRVVE